MRLDVSQKVHNDLNVFFTDRLLFNSPSFIEGHVQEVELFVGNAAAASSCTGFASTDDALELLNFVAINLTGALLLQELVNMAFERSDGFCGDIERCTEFRCEFGEANRVFIEDGNIAGSLVRDMNVVSLIGQANQRASH